MRHKLLLMVAVCITITVPLSRVLTAETLRFATIDYCPFTCVPLQEDGKEGLMTDVLRVAMERAGYTIEIVQFPYIRAVAVVNSGEFDGIVVVGKEYAPNLVYPDIPTAKQRMTFFTKKGSSWKYEGVDSLSKIVIGLVTGYNTGDAELNRYITKYAETDRVHGLYGSKTIERGFQMLQLGRFTTYLEGNLSALYVLDKQGIQNKISVAGYSNEWFEDYTAFSPHHPKATMFAKMLSDTIREMKESGELETILGNYGLLDTLVP